MDSKEEIRIASCDDDLTGEQLRNFCTQSLDKAKVKYEILVTNSLAELWEMNVSYKDEFFTTALYLYQANRKTKKEDTKTVAEL